MALTPVQAAEVMAALAGKVDNNTLQIIKNLMDLNMVDNNIPAGESYNKIKEYCQRLRAKLRSSGKGIVTDDPEKEMLLVYMDHSKVKRLFNTIPKDGYIAAIPGIHTSSTGEDQLTISLLGADKDLNILSSHLTGSAHGEESWGNRNMMCNLDTILR